VSFYYIELVPWFQHPYAITLTCSHCMSTAAQLVRRLGYSVMILALDPAPRSRHTRLGSQHPPT